MWFEQESSTALLFNSGQKLGRETGQVFLKFEAAIGRIIDTLPVQYGCKICRFTEAV